MGPRRGICKCTVPCTTGQQANSRSGGRTDTCQGRQGCPDKTSAQLEGKTEPNAQGVQQFCEGSKLFHVCKAPRLSMCQPQAKVQKSVRIRRVPNVAQLQKCCDNCNFGSVNVSPCLFCDTLQFVEFVMAPHRNQIITPIRCAATRYAWEGGAVHRGTKARQHTPWAVQTPTVGNAHCLCRSLAQCLPQLWGPPTAESATAHTSWSPGHLAQG